MILATCKQAYDKGIDGIDYSRLISMASLEFGAGNRYIREIIDDLINTNKLVLKDKKLYYVE